GVARSVGGHRCDRVAVWDGGRRRPNPLGGREPSRQLQVLAGRAQLPRHRRTVHANLERLLDGDTILVGAAPRPPGRNRECPRYTAGHVVLPGTHASQTRLESVVVGRPLAQWARPGEAQPLSRDAEGGVAEQGPAPVRLEESNPG